MNYQPAVCSFCHKVVDASALLGHQAQCFAKESAKMDVPVPQSIKIANAIEKAECVETYTQGGFEKMVDVIADTVGKSVLQPWVCQLNFMQQSVLLAAIRGPDGIHKNHIAKVLQRWYRRCILISAFEGKIMTDPYAGGGGSFTGPLTMEHLPGFYNRFHTGGESSLRRFEIVTHEDHSMIGEAVRRYVKTLDELPHHYQLHIMHAAEIIGYKHPDPIIKAWWNRTYEILVQDMHLNVETEAQMDYRLADKEDQWRKSEVVRAE